MYVCGRLPRPADAAALTRSAVVCKGGFSMRAPKSPLVKLLLINRGTNSMKIVSAVAVTAALLLSGCASVEMASKAESEKAKEFNPPSQGYAGVYVYRDSFVGKALKKDIWIDSHCIGESAPDVFFYTEVEGGKNHKVDTESEFSPNTLELLFESGKNYFIRQFIKLGVFVGGAGLEQIPEEQGKKDVAKLEMAKPGKCSEPR